MNGGRRFLALAAFLIVATAAVALAPMPGAGQSGSIEVVDASASPSSVTTGEQLTITATVENVGSADAERDVAFRFGPERTVRSVSLAPGEQRTVSVDLVAKQGGQTTSSVGDVILDPISVDSRFEYAVEDVSARNVSMGDTVDVTWSATNPTSETVTEEIGIFSMGNEGRETVTLAPGESKTFEIAFEARQAGPQHVTISDWTSEDRVHVRNPVVVDDVEVDDRIAVGENVTFTFTVTNTHDSFAAKRHLTASLHTTGGLYASASDDVEVPAGETRTVVREIQVSDPGAYFVAAESQRAGGVLALSNPDSRANVTLDVQPPDRVSTSNEIRVRVRATNHDDTAGGRIVTIRASPDGPVLDAHPVSLQPGESKTVSVSTTVNQTGQQTVYVQGRPVTVESTEPYIQSREVTAVAGTEPSSMPALEGGFSDGILDVEFRTGPGRGAPVDLSGIGADESTRFRVDLVVRDAFDPKAVVANANSVDWELTDRGENGTEISVWVQPTDHSLVSNGPSLGNWTGPNRTADQTFENYLRVAVVGETETGNESVPWARGLAISTNAQRFSAPTYTETDDGSQFSIRVASPHYRADLSVNEGTYTARIPQATLDAWNVSNASELAATYTADPDTEATFEDTEDGVLVTLSYHYSSGTVVVGEAGAVEAVNGSSAGGLNGSGGEQTDASGPGFTATVALLAVALAALLRRQGR